MDYAQEEVDRYFRGRDVYIRRRGQHYHADPECPLVKNPPLSSDSYHTTSFQLAEEGRPDLRNREGITYIPCQCAFAKLLNPSDL